MRHFQRCVRHEQGSPDGDTAGDTETVQGKAHGALLSFAKVIGDQGEQGIHRLDLIRTIGFDHDF